MKYVIISVLSYRYLATGGGVHIGNYYHFLIAVMAGVVSQRINKWLDSKDDLDNK